MRPQGVAHPAQDQWWMAGIHRNVYLYRKQAVFIADYTVRPHILNRDVAAVDLLSPATLDVEVCFEESPVEGSKEIEQLSVRMHVFNSQGECVEKCQRKLTTATYGEPCVPPLVPANNSSSGEEFVFGFMSQAIQRQMRRDQPVSSDARSALVVPGASLLVYGGG